MRMKNGSLFSLVLIASFTHITAMDHKKRAEFIEHLERVAKREEEITKQLEDVKQACTGYQHYQDVIDNCPHPRVLEQEAPHPKDSPCLDCKAAYDNADELTKQLINQKSFEHEVKSAWADYAADGCSND